MSYSYEKGMASVQWMRWIRDTCPRLNTYRISNVSSGTGHWTKAKSYENYSEIYYSHEMNEYNIIVLLIL